jgi:hypothetical protein
MSIIKENEESTSAAAMKEVMMEESKVDGKSFWSTMLETFGMVDGGKSKQTDAICTTVNESLTALQALVKEAAKKDDKFLFALTPLEPLGATMDDLLRAFVMWSCKKKDATISKTSGTAGNQAATKTVSYNVSKAFRRLEIYATWMEDNRSDLEAPLVVNASLRYAHKCWGSKATIDKEGRVVWWFDVGAFALVGIKKELLLKDSLRYLVWQSHIIMLNKDTQDNGLVLVQAMGNKGFFETTTMVPRELGAKLNRLTIGVLPIKIKMKSLDFTYADKEGSPDTLMNEASGISDE